jgi:hypothetical protein
MMESFIMGWDIGVEVVGGILAVAGLLSPIVLFWVVFVVLVFLIKRLTKLE